MKITARSSDANILKSIIDVVGFLIFTILQILQSIYKFFLPQSYHPRKDINGEIALVTGGGGGLGRLLSLRLAKLGATVVLWDINTQGLEETLELVKGIGGKAFAFQCDLADKEDIYRIAKKTQQEVGDVTILINNAGVVSGQHLLNTPDYLIKRTFDVNVIAHFWTVKAFLPHMIERSHGHIVTVASMAGFVGVNKLVDYCSSKFAAVGFDESLRVELAAQGIKGIKTTLICPYFIQQTGMFDNVKLRLLPKLKSNDVADRVVEAIVREEILVMIPGSIKFAIWIRTIMPWSVVSIFLRTLVPDANPHQQVSPSPIVKVREADEEKKTISLSNSLTKLNQRLVTDGKNL